MTQYQHTTHDNRLSDLRQLLVANDIQGYIIPSCDEFQNEYVPQHLRRLEWLSGFSGSNGVAIVMPEQAALYTDGRYLLQAKQQLSQSWDVLDMHEPASCGWFVLADGKNIGYDPMLHTQANLDYYAKLAKRYGFTLKAVPNLIDLLWQRPLPKVKPAIQLDIMYSGQSTEAKTELVVQTMEQGVDYVLITAPDVVGWLLNLRGYAIEYTPVILCYLLLRRDCEVVLFGDEQLPIGYNCQPFQSIYGYIKQLVEQGVVVQCDPQQAPVMLSTLCQVHKTDPCITSKAVKNQTEQDGMRTAGLIDSVALCKFLHWLETSSEAYTTDEIGAAAKLLEFRSEHPLFQMPSFPTISAFASNGAIIHYHPCAATNRKLEKNGLYLVDSGGHYLCGTTDITRVIPIGEPKQEECLHYTLVLKGHIALAMAVFPESTSGRQLDAMARSALWQKGLDYAHGTGHGVGHFLSVHEGPQRIAKGTAANHSLVAGMVLSNEPGYYQEGEYGIRLENLMLVRKAHYAGFLEFELLTWVPFAKKLIDFSMLSSVEREWLYNYHRTIYTKVAPHLDAECARWLHAESYF